MYSASDLKKGLKIEIDGEPILVTDFQFVKPGKGQAFNRVKLRNLKTGRVWERTFKSGDSLEGADVMDHTMEYLYTDGELYYFMDPKTFEQHQADAAVVGDDAKWLKEQESYEITLGNGTGDGGVAPIPGDGGGGSRDDLAERAINDRSDR